MSEVNRLIDELERAVCGDPWHGDAVMTILERIEYTEANAHPSADAHSIREILRHMTSWSNEVRRRLNGAPAADPAGGDWPKASGNGNPAWAREIDAFVAAHNALIQDLRKLSDAQLFAPTRDPRNRETGDGVTRYVLLHGLVQHHAYHAGQIALLTKIC